MALRDALRPGKGGEQQGEGACPLSPPPHGPGRQLCCACSAQNGTPLLPLPQ